jgi:hypothetical protein
MKKGLLGILAVGMITSAANAGTLGMRFAGGGTEIAMAPGDTATVEITFAMTSLDKAVHRVTGIDARLDVGPLAASATGDYVQDGSVKNAVTSVTPGAFANWNTAASSTTPAPFNGSFFFSAGDPAGASGPTGNLTNQAPVVIMSFTIQKLVFEEGDTFIAFRMLDPLPAVYNGPNQWLNRFGYQTINGGQQFETAGGNPGDDRPQDTYHGYETLAPLVIHNVPEPSALALLALGGFAAMRRRK